MTREQTAVRAVRRGEIVVRALLHDPAVVEHGDTVTGADRGQPVCDYHRRSACPHRSQRGTQGDSPGSMCDTVLHDTAALQDHHASTARINVVRPSRAVGIATGTSTSRAIPTSERASPWSRRQLHALARRLQEVGINTSTGPTGGGKPLLRAFRFRVRECGHRPCLAAELAARLQSKSSRLAPEPGLLAAHGNRSPYGTTDRDPRSATGAPVYNGFR